LSAPTDAELLARVASRAALIDRLRELVVDVLRLDLEPEDIEPNLPLFGAGLGLDSMDTLELVLEMELVFQVQSARMEADRYTLRNLNTLADLIETEGVWPISTPA